MLDLSDIAPMIAKPFSPGNAFPADEVARERITFDKAMIGSCTNGSYDDLLPAALVLRAARDAGFAKVARPLVIFPGSGGVRRRSSAGSAPRRRIDRARSSGRVGGEIRQSWCGPCFGQGPDALTRGPARDHVVQSQLAEPHGRGRRRLSGQPCRRRRLRARRLHGAAFGARTHVGRRGVRNLAVRDTILHSGSTTMRILLSVGTCLLLGLATVAAQQQQQAQPQQQQAQPPQEQKQDEPIQGPTFRTGVDLVAVDVSVVDRRGRPIEDLHAAEFAVKIDGEVRRVVSAELIKVDIEAARKQVADKTETFYTSNLTPPQGRQIVIAVDQVNIRPGSLRPVLDAAARFLDMLSPLDQIAFVAYPEPGPRVNFTNDKLRLKRAMQGLVGQQPRARPGTYNIGVSEAINIEERRDQIVLAAVVMRECRSNDPRQLAQCERDIVAESAQIARNSREDADLSLRGLQQLLEQLTFVDGPKSLILISEGLATSETNDLRHLVRLAGAARTAINVLSVDLSVAT